MTIEELTYMGRPKRKSTGWHEPKNRKSGPTLTAQGAARLLGYISDESVHVYARLGPELGGFPAYIPSKDGTSWERKHIPHLTQEERAMRRRLLAEHSKAEIAELRRLPEYSRVLYETLTGVQLFFFEEDILAWKQARPKKEEHKEPVAYSEAERLYVLIEAMKFQTPEGKVHRTKLYGHLAQLPDLYGFRVQGKEGYGKIRRYVKPIDAYKLDAEEMEVLREAQVLIARNNPGDKVEARRLLLAQFGVAEEFSDAQWQWNTRTYAKLKQILDDAGIPDVKIKRHS